MGVLGGNEGFVTTADIYQNFQRLGFSERQIQFAIQRAINKNLITPPRVHQEDTYDRLRILSAGAYTIKKLSNAFTYIDAMLVDVPITDSEYRKTIQHASLTSDRLDRVVNFIDYLNKCWDISLIDLFDWPSHIQFTKNEVSYIRFRTNRQS